MKNKQSGKCLEKSSLSKELVIFKQTNLHFKLRNSNKLINVLIINAVRKNSLHLAKCEEDDITPVRARRRCQTAA